MMETTPIDVFVTELERWWKTTGAAAVQATMNELSDFASNVLVPFFEELDAYFIAHANMTFVEFSALPADEQAVIMRKLRSE